MTRSKRFLWLLLLLTGGVFSFPAQALDAFFPSSAQILYQALPDEGKSTLQRILRGGPFPFDRDGVVFGNFEQRLPKKPRGYYHEYTVATPGLNHRGARRIISGGNPPIVFYYTDDHYRSFRQISDHP